MRTSDSFIFSGSVCVGGGAESTENGNSGSNGTMLRHTTPTPTPHIQRKTHIHTHALLFFFTAFKFKIKNSTFYIDIGSQCLLLLCMQLIAGLSRPLMCYSAHFSMTWFPSIVSGNTQACANACWKMTKVILDLCDESTESYANKHACSTDEDRAKGKPLLSVVYFQTHDLILNDMLDSCKANGGRALLGI